MNTRFLWFFMLLLWAGCLDNDQAKQQLSTVDQPLEQTPMK